jgi:arylsulfatase A-like enzyme
MYLAFTAPHTPFQAPKEYLDRYASISDSNRRAYAAMISVIDDEVGNVLAALDEKKMRENTLIIFQSDNGGVKSAMFSGDTPVQGELPASNGPYRNGKGTLYEGGTRVVAFANWPGKVKAGTVNQMTHTVDWYPTLARLANANLGKNKPLDGVNVWATVSAGAASPRKEIVYNVDPTSGAVRQGDWKLVWTASLPQKVELFDLARDRSEMNDVSTRHPQIVTRLQNRITQLSREMAPPLLMGEAIKLTYYAKPKIPQ